MPLQFNQISPKCQIIELPSVAEHLLMYIIENCEEIAIPSGNELKQYFEPSITFKRANSIQHYNHLELMKLPEFTKSNISAVFSE
uniref:Uncharacterized protein n=1 Tax=Panagrolaimus sp. ES5 TaxID=591445 RepID=A0AC34EZJ6_9BILA